jgi:DNA-binding NarL/FixJ family response regulator
MVYRVLLVDDHEIVRVGMVQLLSNFPDFQVVGQAGNGFQAIEKAKELKPDLVLMDIRMPEMDGLEATREIKARHKKTRVVVLTSFLEDEKVLKAVEAGADGYLLKQINADELADQLRVIMETGGKTMDVLQIQENIDDIKDDIRDHNTAIAMLTDQEVLVLSYIPNGLTNKQIADEIGLSEKTVRNYVSSIYSKLHLRSRSEAAAFAVENHIQEFLPRS